MGVFGAVAASATPGNLWELTVLRPHSDLQSHTFWVRAQWSNSPCNSQVSELSFSTYILWANQLPSLTASFFVYLPPEWKQKRDLDIKRGVINYKAWYWYYESRTIQNQCCWGQKAWTSLLKYILLIVSMNPKAEMSTPAASCSGHLSIRYSGLWKWLCVYQGKQENLQTMQNGTPNI